MDVSTNQFLWSGSLLGFLAALGVLLVGIGFGALVGSRLEGRSRRP